MALERFSFAIDRERPGDHRRGRRERQRQDHAGPPAARADRAAARARCVTAAATLRSLSARASAAEFRREVQAIFQDPYEVYNPFYRVDHVLTTPVRKVPPRGDARGRTRG